MKLVDLPGTYSLTSYTMEERVAREYILSDEVDVIVDVADASALERNLYLTLQLIELGKPVVLALNMMDIVEKRGDGNRHAPAAGDAGHSGDPGKRQKKEGAGYPHARGGASPRPERKHPPLCITTRSWKKTAPTPHDHHREFAMVYSDDIEDKIDIIKEALKKKYPDMFNHRWHALKILEGGSGHYGTISGGTAGGTDLRLRSRRSFVRSTILSMRLSGRFCLTRRKKRKPRTGWTRFLPTAGWDSPFSW